VSGNQIDTAVDKPATVELPAPTGWPIVLAFGFTLIFSGLVTHWSLSALGALLAVAGCVGWFREVLPHEKHEAVSIELEIEPIVTSRREIARIEIEPEHRAFLPVEIYPVSAGVKGGIAGSFAMALLAILYGVLSHGSVWYPINLLAAAIYPNYLSLSTAEIEAFNLNGLLIATVIHGITSLMVGLLYGAMLPMFPRRPILLGGFIAPLMWTGLLYSILGIVNPLLEQRIDWRWFIASQFAFGLVAGWIVARQTKIYTHHAAPGAIPAKDSPE
jgi:hypothetical protein